MTRLVVTGISGCGGYKFLKDVERFAELNNGADFKVYYVGNMMKEFTDEYCQLDINWNNVFQLPDSEVIGFLGAAYREIEHDIEKREKRANARGQLAHSIIKSHATFYVHGDIRESNNARFLQRINPDKFVTLINEPGKIRTNHNLNYPQWHAQNLSIDEIVFWESTEAMTTSKDWAGTRKPHLTLPVGQPAESLFKFIATDAPVVYSSFPMTQLEKDPDYQKYNEMISDFINFLRDYFVVIDPRTIEVAPAATHKERTWTARRDLIWAGKEAMATACYYPKLVHSSGALTEIIHAYTSGKDVWLTAPKRPSPFDDLSCTNFFEGVEEFMKFISDNYDKLNLKRFD